MVDLILQADQANDLLMFLSSSEHQSAEQDAHTQSPVTANFQFVKIFTIALLLYLQQYKP